MSTSIFGYFPLACVSLDSRHSLAPRLQELAVVLLASAKGFQNGCCSSCHHIYLLASGNEKKLRERRWPRCTRKWAQEGRVATQGENDLEEFGELRTQILAPTGCGAVHSMVLLGDTLHHFMGTESSTGAEY